MGGTSGNQQTLCLPYYTLRIIIGILGITFPFILSVGAWIFFGTGLQDSISEYYLTGMRDIFVGFLFVIGFFLMTYAGYDLIDNIVSTVGGISAVLAAILPTTAGGPITVIGILHFVFAALFFLTLIYFALVLFPKTDPNVPPTPEKLLRNKVYRTCGWIMLICILLIFIYSFLPENLKSQLDAAFHPEFWLETIAVVAFGICWLVKGQAILKDSI